MKTDAVLLVSNSLYWQARWRDSAGRRVVKSLGPKSKVPRREAVRLCRELAKQHATQPSSRDARGAPTLGEWLRLYAESRAGMADTTKVLDEQAGSALKDHFGEGIRLDVINRASAAAFRQWLARRKFRDSTIGATTVAKYIGIVSHIFAEAQRLDMVPFNPFDRESSVRPKVDRAWRYVTIDELEKLLAACPDDAWRSLFALGRMAGLRLGEALALKWTDIDWNARTLTVVPRRGVQTTKEARRVVPMEPRLHGLLLERFNAVPAGSIYVVGLGTNNLRRDGLVIIKRAELSPWDKWFHTLRKNLETDWLAKYPALDVFRWIGHDEAVARAHYHQTKPETIAQVTGGKTVETELRAEIERLKAQLAGKGTGQGTEQAESLKK